MKKFGIYLLNRPDVDLRAEGLGRHLASFLKGGKSSGEARWVIACPFWMKSTLEQTLGDFDLQSNDFEIITTNHEPVIVKIYKRLNKFVKNKLPAAMQQTTTQMTPSFFSRMKRYLMRMMRVNRTLISIYFWIEKNEGIKLNNLIEKRNDITSWYCPTLFWPVVTELKRPLLICAPDLFMNYFPIGFAIHAPHSLRQFIRMRDTIRQGKYFTTYSLDVKENTLTKLHNKDPSHVHVIHHGANRLDELIDPQDRNTSIQLLEQALKTAREGYYASSTLEAGHFKYLFYASQARPNKNLFTLIKVFNYLIHERKLKYKLILTGDPTMMPELEEYARELKLEEDILWLNRMPANQLAACYHLAELSVNPTFSEGGFPFTFTESLSVGTPVVMSRINVTDEIITDPELNEMMLFDPYDWKIMANKIEWALENKETLLNKQMPLYKQLKQRNWNDVVKDYVKVLDQISEQGARP